MASPAWKTVGAHVLTSAVTLAVVLGILETRFKTVKPAASNSLPASVFSPRVNPPESPPVIPPEVLDAADADEQVNIRVYASVNRSVVNITAASEASTLFGEETSTGTGSGFVIDDHGHVLTNFHVVEKAETLQVTLFDGTSHEARVIGIDASNDVAVVKIEAPADRLFPVAPYNEAA